MRNSSRSSRPNSNSSRSYRANFLRSLSLRFRPYRVLAQVASACQVHPRGRRRTGGSPPSPRGPRRRAGPRPRWSASSTASSKVLPLKSRASNSTPSRWPTHSAKLAGAVVVGEEPVDGVADLVVDHLQDRVLGRRAVEEPLAEAVDALPLVVHHLVVFEQVLADVEVALLDLLLGRLDPAGDHPALDGLALLHAEPGEHGRRPTRRRTSASGRLPATGRTGDEPGSPWRPARPRSWLSMRRLSCRSVPMMCRPPIAATSRPSAFISGSYLATVSSQTSLRDLQAGRVERAAVRVVQLLQVGPGHGLGVAAQDDVGAAAGHVGGDRHRADCGRPGRRSRPRGTFVVLALSSSCLMPCRLSISASFSDFSIDVVPIRIGRPVSWTSLDLLDDRVPLLPLGAVDRRRGG